MSTLALNAMTGEQVLMAVQIETSAAVNTMERGVSGWIGELQSRQVWLCIRSHLARDRVTQ